MSNKQQIEDSLKSLILNDDREFVAMLSGEWGIGKTYFWNELANRYLKNKNVVYISLFGKNSLADIETEVVTKLYKYNKGLKKYTKHLDAVGNMASNAMGLPINVSIGSLLSLFKANDFKNIVICFDDFERLSDKVPLKDVMGLISQFKEQKECKVIMILNEKELDKLSDIDGKKHDEIFALYKEKVVDYNFHYQPSQDELFEVIKEDIDKIKLCEHQTIYDFFKEIDLKNIRIMQQALYQLGHFEFVKDYELDAKVINGFVEIALNLFVFKAKTNYTMKEWYSFLSYHNEKSSFEGRMGRVESNKKYDNDSQYYHDIKSSQYIYLNEKVETQVYSFIESHLINNEELGAILDEKSRNLKLDKAQKNIRGLSEKLYISFSRNNKDIAEELKGQILKYQANIHLMVSYLDFETFIEKIEKYTSPFDEDIKGKIIKNYIEYYADDKERDRDHSKGARSYLKSIIDKYDWAKEHLKRYRQPDKITSEEAIAIIRDAVRFSSIYGSQLIRLDALEVEDYRTILINFPENIIDIIKFCKSSKSEEFDADVIIKKIKGALKKLSLESKEYKDKAEYIARQAGISLDEEEK